MEYCSKHKNKEIKLITTALKFIKDTLCASVQVAIKTLNAYIPHARQGLKGQQQLA
jgi:hypothetical protein